MPTQQIMPGQKFVVGVPLFAPMPNVIAPPAATSAEFPPDAWLGYGLDMTPATPGDIGSITQAIKTASAIIVQDDETKTREFKCGATWEVPKIVNASDDVKIGSSNYNSYHTGTEAFSAFQADAGLTAKYMAVSGSVSVGASINKMFSTEYSYAFFTYNANLINVFFKNWADYVAEKGLKKRLQNLGKFDASYPDLAVIRRWKSFFKAFGTHVITSCTYGARFQLNVWASNTDSSAKEKFNVNISAEYNGLTTGGKFDSSVTSTEEYSKFQQSVQKTCSCQGGDPKKAVAVSASPNDEAVYQHYQDWVRTTDESPNVMSMQTVALWDVLGVAADPELVAFAPSAEDVFKYIVAHPALHMTKCRFVINSDWAEIGLLTPSAFIRQDPDSPPGRRFLVSTTKVSWGREHSEKYRRDVTVDFIIENDGSPVDIMLSHGSNGDRPGSGRCENTYDNVGIKGNNWNSEWFYACDVNPTES